MSLPAETQRTIEAIYDDFQYFISRADFSQAKECIKHMSDYSPIEAKRMEKEYNRANFTDLALRVLAVTVIVSALLAIYLWRTA